MSARTFRLVLVLICALYAAQGLHYARVLIPVHDAVMYLFIGAKATRWLPMNPQPPVTSALTAFLRATPGTGGPYPTRTRTPFISGPRVFNM